MKDIYFIRHGQTEKNKKHIHQHYDEPLSKEGIEQARIAAGFIKTLNIQELIASPFARARETAEVMGKAIALPYIIDTSVHETIRPTYLYGASHFSFKTFRYLGNLFIHHHHNEWSDDGAENMFSIRNRVHDAKDMIMETGRDRIAIVSHAVFIDMFIHLVCSEEGMSIFQFVHMVVFIKKMPNTSVAHLQYNPDAPRGMCQWQYINLITPEEFNK